MYTFLKEKKKKKKQQQKKQNKTKTKKTIGLSSVLFVEYSPSTSHPQPESIPLANPQLCLESYSSGEVCIRLMNVLRKPMSIDIPYGSF